jgi:hypothetical protein
MIASKRQLAAILRAMRDDHPKQMTTTQYKAALAAVGLYQEQAGEFFGWSKRRGQAWALGEAAIPWQVQWCLEFMVEHGVSHAAMEANLQAN